MKAFCGLFVLLALVSLFVGKVACSESLKKLGEWVLERAGITYNELCTIQGQQKILALTKESPEDMRVIYNAFKDGGLINAA